MKKTGLILATIAIALTTACGANADDKNKADNRPTATQISKTLATKTATQPQALPKAQADCAAKLLTKSKLSDKALKALVAQSKTYKPSTADTKVLSSIGKTINTTCA